MRTTREVAFAAGTLLVVIGGVDVGFHVSGEGVAERIVSAGRLTPVR